MTCIVLALEVFHVCRAVVVPRIPSSVLGLLLRLGLLLGAPLLGGPLLTGHLLDGHLLDGPLLDGWRRRHLLSGLRSGKLCFRQSRRRAHL